MKTPKRKRASSAAKAAAPAMEARALDETSVMPAPVSDPDLEQTSTLPAIVVAAEAAIEIATANVAVSVSVADPVRESIAEPAAAQEPVSTSSAEVPVDSDPVIALPSNSTVKDAASLKAALIEVVGSPRTVALDVRIVERVDTATIQLLCAFVLERSKRQLGVKWLDCPKAFIESSRLLGVQALLGLPGQGVA